MSKPVLPFMNSVTSGRVLEKGEACPWLSFSRRGKKLACDMSFFDRTNVTAQFQGHLSRWWTSLTGVSWTAAVRFDVHQRMDPPHRAGRGDHVAGRNSVVAHRSLSSGGYLESAFEVLALSGPEFTHPKKAKTLGEMRCLRLMAVSSQVLTDRSLPANFKNCHVCVLGGGLFVVELRERTLPLGERVDSVPHCPVSFWPLGLLQPV